MQITGNGKICIYEYNEDGIRTSKNVAGVATTYYLNENKIQASKTGIDIICYSYDSFEQAVIIFYTNNMYYYLYNAQNNVVGLLDKDGNTVVSYLYDVWGNISSVTGSMATTLGVDNPFRYRGYFYDEETKFYYLQSRYYDPSICRFINADELKELYNATSNVLGANVFAYCMNNPVIGVDHTGKGWIPRWVVSAPIDAFFMFFTMEFVLAPLKCLTKIAAQQLVKKYAPQIVGLIGRAIVYAAGVSIRQLFNISANTLLNLILPNLSSFISIGGIVAFAADYFTDYKIDGRISY